MMKIIASLLLLTTLQTPLTATATVATPTSQLRGADHDQALFCHLFVASAAVIDEAERVSKYQCMFDNDDNNGIMHEIDLPVDFLKDHESLILGTPILKIPGGQMLDNGAVHVPDFSTVTIHAKTSPRRRLAPRSGTPNVLAVYVTAPGETPRDSASDMRGRIFQKGPQYEDNTVITQYDKCSFGKQKIQETSNGSNIVDGVVEVSVPFSIGGSTPCNILGDCKARIEDATARRLGKTNLDEYDFLMFCVPDGSMFGAGGKTTWAAFGYTGSQSAWFQRGFCSVLTTNQHELGHVMGFGHSNEGGVRQDKSGVLGTSILDYGGPEYCLNGQKYAMSGWMDERKEVVTLSRGQSGYTGRLVAFVDMQDDDLKDYDRTLIEIDTNDATKENSFALYNRAKGFNKGTREKGDLVTVVQQQGDRQSSEMVAGLDVGEQTTIPGTQIVFKACAKGTENGFDFTKISIYDPSLGQSETCNVALGSATTTASVNTPSSSTSSGLISGSPPSTTGSIIVQNQSTIARPQSSNIINNSIIVRTPVAPAPPAPAPPAPAPPAPAPAPASCFLRKFNERCRRGSNCCSGVCTGSGWSARCD